MTHGDRAPETVVAEFRANGAVLAFPSILLVATAAAAGTLVFRLPESWMRWSALGGGALLVLVAFVVPLIRWLSRRYVVTTRRTIIREGVFSRSRREVLHSRVLEVTVRRSAGQAIIGSGDVVLEFGGGRSAVLRGVRSPGLVQGAISDLVDAQRVERDGRFPTA